MTKYEWTRQFARRLAMLMSECGYSQSDLAIATGLSQATISFYLNCQRTPKITALLKLADALGVDTRELIDFGERIEM